MTGSTAVFDREALVGNFRRSPDGILVMTSVGAEGIDLQFCSTLVNYDLTWNPMVLEQRIGRIDRIGQTKAVINIYNFVVSGSIDERIIATLGRKLGLIEGSVLEPATVLQSAPTSRKAIFSRETLRAEEKKAELVFRAVEFSRDITPEDYDIIQAIDIGYCRPQALQEAAARTNGTFASWLKTTDDCRVWRDLLIRRSKELQEIIDFYGD